MTRIEFEKCILEKYDAATDFPWLQHPDYQVFRHKDNQKWFALIMDIPKNKLGLEGTELLNVVNLKCDPIMISSFWRESGVFPGYHMNKNNWLTVALDGSASEDTIRFLLDMSFQLTGKNSRKRQYRPS